MSLVVLYLLASVDAAAASLQCALGRNALIDKRRFYIQALSWGFWRGQALLGIWLAVGIAWAFLDPEGLNVALATASRFGDALLMLYLPYAALIGAAWLFRLSRSIDIRSMTSVLVFGPLTLLRPAVALAGWLWAFCAVDAPAVACGAGAVILSMFGLERFMRARAERWRV